MGKIEVVWGRVDLLYEMEKEGFHPCCEYHLLREQVGIWVWLGIWGVGEDWKKTALEEKE